jgi:hypothetical protein
VMAERFGTEMSDIGTDPGMARSLRAPRGAKRQPLVRCRVAAFGRSSITDAPGSLGAHEGRYLPSLPWVA